MIFYEKLKIAHELADKYAKKEYRAVDITIRSYISSDQAPAFLLKLFTNHSQLFETIDDLITKLEEITKTEPKYKQGDEAWFIDCRQQEGPIKRDIAICSDLRIELFNEEKFYVNFGGDLCIPEDCVFSTKAELIEAQITYWMSQREETIEAGQGGTTRPFAHYPAHSEPYDLKQKICCGVEHTYTSCSWSIPKCHLCGINLDMPDNQPPSEGEIKGFKKTPEKRPGCGVSHKNCPHGADISWCIQCNPITYWTDLREPIGLSSCCSVHAGTTDKCQTDC